MTKQDKTHTNSCDPDKVPYHADEEFIEDEDIDDIRVTFGRRGTGLDSTGHPGERPISSAYPVIDTDVGRDNVENDLSAADLQDL